MGKKRDKVYGVFSDTVSARDKYRVPNICRVRKYSTKTVALKKAVKNDGDKVFVLSRKELRRICSGRKKRR